VSGDPSDEQPAGARSHSAARTGESPSRAIVARASSRRGLEEAELVLRATGYSSSRRRYAGEWLLLVSVADALRAEAELRRYAEEQRDQPEGARAPSLRGAPLGVTPFLSAGALLASWTLQQQPKIGPAWVRAARLDVEAVRDGEIWRLFTSLLLHADARHLIGNVGIGAVFLGLLTRTLGGPLALAASLLAAVFAHAVEVALVTPPRFSLGASTAVFACLGLLVGQGYRWRRRARDGWLRSVGGAACGLALLSWLGAGDERTDVLAHLLGFVMGLGLGLLRPPRPAPGARTQAWLAAAVYAVILGAFWSLRGQL